MEFSLYDASLDDTASESDLLVDFEPEKEDFGNFIWMFMIFLKIFSKMR
jgi:hypothetical protein